MRTAKDFAKYLDKTGTLLSDGLQVAVKILDAKEAYGQLRLQVTPLSGAGEVWVSVDRVNIN